MSHYDLEDFDGLPHPEVRLLISQLREGSHEEQQLRGMEVQRRLNEAGLQVPLHNLPVLSSITGALSLIPEDWWWHISHLVVEVIPTTPGPGASAAVITNGRNYDKHGRPITYNGSCHYDRKAIPAAICEAMLKAAYNLPAGFAVQATATEEEPEEVIKARQQRLADRARERANGD